MNRQFHVTFTVSVQKLVVENMEVLTQMRTSFDKPDHMAALFKKLTCKDTHTHTHTQTWLPETNALEFYLICALKVFKKVNFYILLLYNLIKPNVDRADLTASQFKV